jgi:hypothetical protein
MTQHPDTIRQGVVIFYNIEIERVNRKLRFSE